MNKALLCTFVLLAMGVLQAQSQEPDSSKSKTAILFNIVDLNLEGYNGGIGFKFGVGKNYAIKTSLDFNYSDNKDDRIDDVDVESQLTKAIGLSVNFERYISFKQNLSFYFGIGAGLNWSVYKYDYTSNSGSYMHSEERKSTSIKANALFGAEYELSKTFSLSFQQIISGSHSFGKEKNNSYGTKTEYDTESFNVGFGSTSLTLLLYF